MHTLVFCISTPCLSAYSCHYCAEAVVYLNFVVFASHEVDDSLGQRGSEPEHQYGQHTETVRVREKQSHRKKSQ